MTTVQQNSNSQEIAQIEAMLAAALQQQSEKEGDKSTLAVLIATLSEVLASLQGNNSNNSNAPTPESLPPPPAGANGPTEADMSRAVAQLAAALSELQVLLGKYGAEKQNLNNSDMQAMIDQAQAAVKKAEDDLQKLQEQQSHHSFWDIFLKVITAVVGAIFTAVALLTGQVELAIVIVALTVASETGAFGAATKAVSDLLQALGVPAKDANIIASVLVIVATIVLTVATCGAAAPEAAADVGEEVADTTAQEVEQTVQETVTETTSEESNSVLNTVKNALNKVGNFVKEYNPFSKLSTTTNMAIMTGSQAVMGSNFATYLVEALPGLSSKEKEKLEKILNIIQDIICTIASVGSGMAVGSASSAAEQTYASTTALRALNIAGYGAQVAGAGGNFALAHVDFEMAQLQASLGTDYASSNLFQNLMKMVETMMQKGTQNTTSALKSHTEELNALLSDLPKAGQALAQVLVG